MSNKKFKIANIMNSIKACTGMNFQKRVTTILEILCEEKGATFEKVEPMNGDGKNDGWIKDRNIYFAMFSPSDAVVSQNNQIVNKLKKDLNGLCELVFEKGCWGKDIKEFYLIVNTHDKDLPADPTRLREKESEKIKRKFDRHFKVEVISQNEIKKYLLSQTDELIDKVSDNLDIETIIGDFSVADILNFVDEYTKYLACCRISTMETDYLKIPTEKKIEINQLNNKKAHILSLIDASDKIEQYVTFTLSEGGDLEKYNSLKNYIIGKYKELSVLYSGEMLYDKLLNELVYDSMLDSHIYILEAFIVNIFVRCDIFEKEN